VDNKEVYKMKKSELLDTYFAEAEELLNTIENQLLALESNPEASEPIQEMFRSAHSLKSASAMMGFMYTSKFSHSLEEVFDRLRKGELPVTKNLISLLLNSVDFLRMMHSNITSGKPECKAEEISQMQAKLKRFLSEVSEEEPTKKFFIEPERPSDSFFEISMKFRDDIFNKGQDPLMLLLELDELGEIIKVVSDISRLPDFDNIDMYKLYISWRLVLKTREHLSKIEDVFIFTRDENDIEIKDITRQFREGVNLKDADKFIGELLLEQGIISEEDIQSVIKEQKKTGKVLVEKGIVDKSEVEKIAEYQKKARLVHRRSTIRIDLEKVDKVVGLVEEMAIALMQIGEITSEMEPSAKRRFEIMLKGLYKICHQLEEQVMKMRMFPLEGTFYRLQRQIRDLAYEQKKQIRVVISGEDTELDKEVIEIISDPLKHLVRNAVDHGIELPSERECLGKPREGTIWLKGYQREGRVYIEIKDDGRGIDKEAVLKKAIEQGIVKPDPTLSDEEVYELMFHPLISTAKQVTSVSGRGVGLDVVKHNVTKAGGRIKILSEVGRGTTFIIELPLTLAIIEGTIIRANGEVFTIPMNFIVEFFKPLPHHIRTIEEHGELVNVRGEFLPLIRLNKVFMLGNGSHEPKLVAILKGNKKFGVVIDEVLGEQRVLIKSLKENLFNPKGIAGATVLGDGSVSLVIDVTGLEELAFG